MRRLTIMCVLLCVFFTSRIYSLDESKVKEHYLKNGMKVITYELKTSPVVFSRLCYNVGSKYEPYGKSGISHIVEHMMFKGTKKFGKGTISKLISSHGGIFNAYTSNDVTVYYELVPKNKIDLVFDIESERMHKCVFDPEEYKSELKVIREERKQRTDNQAKGIRREEMNTLLYKNHPYRNPVIGWEHDLYAIDRDMAYEYYQKYYTPNNATLVLVGDFDTDEIMKKVKEYFGKISKGPRLDSVDFFRVPQSGKKTLTFKHADVLNPTIQMYFQAPTRFSEDGPALFVLGNIMCAKKATSRLYKRLVRKEKLCDIVGGGLRLSKDPTTFNIVAKLMPDTDVDSVETIIMEEIDRMKTEPVSEHDLQRIVNRITFDELTAQPYADRIGNKIGMYDNYFNWKEINAWPEKIKEVTRDDIMRVAKKYFVEDQLSICYSYPDTTKKEALETDVEEEEEEEEEREEKLGDFDKLFQEYALDIKDVPEINPIAPMIDSFFLDNGVPVYFLYNPEEPTLTVMGMIETGRLKENWENPGVKHFTEALLSRGTKNRTYDEIVEEKSFTPYFTKISQSWDQIVLQGYSLVKDDSLMLNYLYESLTEPSFPEEEIEKLRKRFIVKSKQHKSTETMKAFYSMFEKVFEDHQYSVPYAGSPEVYEKLTRDDLVEFYNKYYHPDHLNLFVVGQVEKEDLKKKLNSTFGKWEKKGNVVLDEFSEQKKISGKHVYVFNNPDYKQCRLDMAFCPVDGGIYKKRNDLDAVSVLEYILCGSSLTSRMGVELRDKQGLSYGIKSNLWIRQYGGYWNIRTNLDSKNITKMVDGIFHEIKKIQKEGITDEELKQAKVRLISLMPLYVRSTGDIGSMIFNNFSNNLPFDHFDKKRERILKLTKEDIRQAALKYFDTDNYIISVSGNVPETVLDDYK